VGGALSTVRQGTYRHAAYIIEVPPRWNGDLVMWAHGYRGQGTVLTAETPAYGLRQKLLDQGYAWAASSYTGNGFDIRSGVVSTKELADRFGQLVRRPHRTYIAGVSMGGYIIGRSLEQYPHLYDGALPLCGVMGDQRLIDYFLDYQLTAEALSGITTYPAGPDYLSAVVPAVQQKLGLAGVTPLAPEPTNALGRQFRDITVNQSGGPRPGAAASFAYWKDFLFGLGAPAASSDTPAQDPGLISTNLFTRYAPNAPVNVNRVVRRVAPEEPRERLSHSLTQVPKIDGRPRVPVLSLHGLGDLFVPFVNEQQYRADVDRHSRSRLLVQRAIRATEHCEFSPAEVGTAWDDLVKWVHHDRRPAGDRLDARSVANPDYGCRFSDKAAYATGTRRLYPACP
jgi:pimeloyl-ACP methyl ester carboxylesterase